MEDKHEPYSHDEWQDGEGWPRPDLNLHGQLNAFPVVNHSRVFVADASISDADEWPEVIGE